MQCGYTSSQPRTGWKGRNGLRDLPAGGEGLGSLISTPLLTTSPALRAGHHPTPAAEGLSCTPRAVGPPGKGVSQGAVHCEL